MTCECESFNAPSNRHALPVNFEKINTMEMFSVDDKDAGVAALDDRGLQDLLNEAIAYKNPKDRDNKSDLFKELLAKAEADEREHSGGQRGISSLGGNSGRYRRGPSRKGDVSERNSRGGSLQNLVHALNSDLDIHVGSTNRKRGGRRNPQPQVSVSARQREGGSLPCNVNADFYTAAALRSHDDVSTSSSLKKRDHPTPPDDVVTGNSYSYKLASASCARTAEDLSGYRPSHSGKRATDSLDDIETVVSRGSGSKRRELKKLGHSSDAIFPESTSDEICSMEDLHKEADISRLANNKFENENLIDLSDFATFHLRPQNNVDRSSADHSVVDDIQSQLNGTSILGVGMNGTVRSGPDRWLKSEPRKDEDMDGTEMTPIERTSEISKYPTSRPNEHEVDQTIQFLRKSQRSNGEHIVPPLKLFPTANFAAGDSVRSTSEAAPTRPRALIHQYQVPTLDKNLHVWVSDSAFLSKDTDKKSFDENGNALQGTGSERKYKTRKNKTDNNNYVLSEKIPGHRGGTQDINELVLFIESPSNCTDKSSISGKNTRNTNGPVNLKDSKQRNSSSNGKRSEAGGTKVKLDKRKSGDKPKLKKSNSLEEISCTKLSDLTSSDNSSVKGTEKQLKKQSTLDEVVITRESRQKSVRSTGSNCSVSDKGTGSTRSSSNRKQRESSSTHRVTPPPSNPVDTVVNTLVQGGEIIGDPSEFHVVTKKQRKKKPGRSSSIGRNERSHHSTQSNNYHREAHSRRSATMDDGEGHLLYQYRSAPYRSESPEHSQHQRRKSTSSMPPSDKSADSSDLDSVHSLPASTTPRPALDKSSNSSGSTPQVSYADIARMASAMSPPQACPFVPAAGSQTPILADGQTQGLANKWPSVGQARPPATPLWTANVTLHTATPLPASHEEGEQCFAVAVPAVSSSTISSSTKRDAMTNTVSQLESEPTDCSSVGNLLSDLSYPPLCESGKTPQTFPPQSVTPCVQTFISQASRSSPAISPGVTMANCVDVEDSAKRAASPAAFDSVRDNARSSALDRPAVIILDEAETETPVDGDPELTFGFEINEMLLSGSCVLSSDDEADIRLESTASVNVEPSMTSVANINLDKIVAFVGRAWEDVIKELPREAGARGRVQFYNGQ
ncbi:uncharacterized protein LOC117642576 isoform X2 [Thrips palmi]|uniref:Uncharacterized protein LOC117642576 isoform X2 n=1 Tax=Thrips palmi TaxID=161013 RepID=A0A6P8YID3_THRPL|nr:uncharacterized protein LOC117642576 isoform X2 [Thrips palmi]